MESLFVFVGNHCDDKKPWCTAPTKIILSETDKNSMGQIIREAIKKNSLNSGIARKGRGVQPLPKCFWSTVLGALYLGRMSKGGGCKVIDKRFGALLKIFIVGFHSTSFYFGQNVQGGRVNKFGALFSGFPLL